MEYNWEEMGIVMEREEVRKRFGPNNSDIRSVGEVPIPTIVDLGKFIAFFGEKTALASINGTSVRIQAQDTARRMAAKGLAYDVIETAIYNRLRNVRTAALTRTVEVKKYALPGGDWWTGTDVAEYQRAYVAAAVDAGVPSDVALTLAKTLTL